MPQKTHPLVLMPCSGISGVCDCQLEQRGRAQPDTKTCAAFGNCRSGFETGNAQSYPCTRKPSVQRFDMRTGTIKRVGAKPATAVRCTDPGTANCPISVFRCERTYIFETREHR